MGKKTVVLDTNILISALGWQGKPRQVFQKVLDGELNLIISESQLRELLKTMSYPKFRFTQRQKARFLMILLKVATRINPERTLRIIKEDPDDNLILESAVKGNAEYIISGDTHLLLLQKYKHITILSASEFLELMYRKR